MSAASFYTKWNLIAISERLLTWGQIEDLEKYSVKNNNNTDYLSIVEIKNIVDKFDKLGFSVEKNIILFKIKVVESKKLYHKEIFH